MSVDGVDFDEAWPGRGWINFGEVSGWVIGREALIKNKLASGRPQDIVDAEIVRRSSD